MKAILPGGTALLLAALIVGGCAKPEIGDRFEITAEVFANPNLSAYDQGMYYAGRRGDRAMVQSMVARGEIFTLDAGTTGVIVGFPRPASWDSTSGSNLNDMGASRG